MNAPWKRRALIALLSVGTVGGFGSGFASLKCRHHHRRAQFEQHVADLCVQAAARAQTVPMAAPPPAAEAHHADPVADAQPECNRRRHRRPPHHPPRRGHPPHRPPPHREASFAAPDAPPPAGRHAPPRVE